MWNITQSFQPEFVNPVMPIGNIDITILLSMAIIIVEGHDGRLKQNLWSSFSRKGSQIIRMTYDKVLSQFKLNTLTPL